MPKSENAIVNRLVRWQLAQTAPAALSLDHPVQLDLAAAADEIIALEVALAACVDKETHDMVRDAITDLCGAVVQYRDTIKYHGGDGEKVADAATRLERAHAVAICFCND